MNRVSLTIRTRLVATSRSVCPVGRRRRSGYRQEKPVPKGVERVIVSSFYRIYTFILGARPKQAELRGDRIYESRFMYTSMLQK